MNQVSLEHPSAECLAAFGLGQLPESESATIEQHITVCEPCRQAVDSVAPDSLVGLLKASPTEAGPPTEGLADENAATDGATRAAKPSAADSATLPPDAATATVIDVPAALADHPRYRIQDLLGIGGMGAVYKAEHRLMRRHVALKVINPKFMQSKQAVERFRREVEAAARLHHPNIVTAHDAEQAGDLHYLVMEYVPGTDLGKVLEERGPLPVAEACEYIRQAALGLQHAHENGMVHRDIKPQNLMLSGARSASEGRPAPSLALRAPTVKILDFGLASLAAVAETDATPESPSADQKSGLTQAGSLMGTPDYMAPEQAKDARTADIRSDIYSLGCTLYALLTGKVPFPGGTAIDKVIAHSTSEPQPIAEVRKEVPAALVKVLDKMMAKDPAKRYQTPAEVAAALAPAAAALGLPRTGGRGRSRRRTLVALGTIAAGLLLVAAGIVFYFQTADGVVRFEINDPAIKVVIDQGAVTITGADPKPITLKPGRHRLTITRDDFAFDTTFFELKRGGSTRLKIDWLDTAVVVRQDGLVIGQKPRPPDERAVLAKIDAAHKAAENWLTLVDQGKYGEAWELQARAVKQMVAKEASERTYQHVLKQIGKNKLRIIFKRDYSSNIPGLPPGEYVVVQYSSRFEKLKESLESLVLMFDRDNQWRAVNYSAVNWPYPGEFPAPGGFAWPLAPQAEVINTFGPAIRPLTTEGVTLDDKAWKLESAGSKTFEMYEIPPIAEDCMLVCRAKMKSKLTLGRAFLEMWCIDDNGQKYFSKGIYRPLVGTTNWNTYEIPFYLKKGEQPEKVRINVAIEGGGTVWIKDVELKKAALPKGFGQSPLDGTWKPVAVEQNGQAVPEELLKKIDFPAEFVFKGNRWGAVARSGKRYESAFTLDVSKTPAWIEVKGSLFEGMPDMHGILKLEGDTITVCVVEKDRPRPTEFKTKVNTGQMLIVARRISETDAKLDAAARAADAWLKLMDAGDYGRCWEESASIARRTESKAAFTREYTETFKDRGKLKARALVRRQYAAMLTDLPKGEYVTLEYQSSFASAADAFEVVNVMLDQDGAWRVITYEARPRAPNPDAKSDEERIQGAWRPVAGEFAGRKLTDDELKGTRATFKDETLTLTLRMGKESLRMTGPFALDARKDPKRITFIIQQTPKDQKGAASNTGIHGIYRFDGDRLVLCITEGADRRPTQFATSKQTPDQFLLTFEK